MNFRIDIDCTPEEARRFLGLPDVQDFQKEMMEELQEHMKEQVRSMDPEALMKSWLPTDLHGWENLQQAFMKGFTGSKESGNG